VESEGRGRGGAKRAKRNWKIHQVFVDLTENYSELREENCFTT
jgi:hypothetical protein